MNSGAPQRRVERKDSAAAVPSPESGGALRIRTRCAWCQVLIHDGVLFQGKHESHGICKACDKKLRAEMGL